MTGKKLVYIVGFMGSGKSTVGKKLAASLGWDFIDLDRKIEEVSGKTIPKIFEADGEEAFRELESGVLQNLKTENHTVISTGGGTPCHGNNMDIMRASGLTIYLKMEPSQLAARLLESTADRPLLRNIPDDRLNEYIITKLSGRESWYNKSDLIIEGKDVDISLLSSTVKDMLFS